MDSKFAPQPTKSKHTIATKKVHHPIKWVTMPTKTTPHPATKAAVSVVQPTAIVVEAVPETKEPLVTKVEHKVTKIEDETIDLEFDCEHDSDCDRKDRDCDRKDRDCDRKDRDCDRKDRDCDRKDRDRDRKDRDCDRKDRDCDRDDDCRRDGDGDKDRDDDDCEKKRKAQVRTRNVNYPPGQDPIQFPLSQCFIDQQLTWHGSVIITNSAVEPTVVVNPKNRNQIVTAWQNDRINNSGALEIGIAFTNNHGRTWQNSAVPLQFCGNGPFPPDAQWKGIQRSSDPWLAYRADGKVVFLSVLVFNVIPWPSVAEPIQYGVIVTRSFDNGRTWTTPVYVITSADTLTSPPGLPFCDKNTITADPYCKKNVYQTWNRVPAFPLFHSDAWFTRSNDGGKTWFPATLIYNPTRDLFESGLSNGIENNNMVFNNQIIVLPCGDLLNFMVRTYALPSATSAQFFADRFPFQFRVSDIAVIRSKDGGYTWSQTAVVVANYSINNRIFTNGYIYSPFLPNSNDPIPLPQINLGHILAGRGELLRTGDNCPGYASNKRTGDLYVAFQDARTRPDLLPQIYLTISRDGGRKWSVPVQVNRTPQKCIVNPQAFTPGVAVLDNGLVGISYNDFRFDRVLNKHTLTDQWLAIYKDDGAQCRRDSSDHCQRHCQRHEDELEFIEEVRLSKHSYIAENGPVTDGGKMTNGDYPGIDADHGEFYVAYTKSTDGPYPPPQTIRGPEIIPPGDRPVSLIVEVGLRTNPFVSIVRSSYKDPKDDCDDDKDDRKDDDCDRKDRDDDRDCDKDRPDHHRK